MEDLEVERRLLHEFQDLLQSPAWDRLSKFAEMQISARREQLLLPAHERGASDRQPPSEEYLKGELQGIRLFLRMPEILIDQAKALIESEEQKDVNPESDESRSAG